MYAHMFTLFNMHDAETAVWSKNRFAHAKRKYFFALIDKASAKICTEKRRITFLTGKLYNKYMQIAYAKLFVNCSFAFIFIFINELFFIWTKKNNIVLWLYMYVCKYLVKYFLHFCCGNL